MEWIEMNKNQKDERHLKPPEEWTEYESALDFQERCNSQTMKLDLTPEQIERAEKLNRRLNSRIVKRFLSKGNTIEMLREKGYSYEWIQDALSYQEEE